MKLSWDTFKYTESSLVPRRPSSEQKPVPQAITAALWITWLGTIALLGTSFFALIFSLFMMLASVLLLVLSLIQLRALRQHRDLGWFLQLILGIMILLLFFRLMFLPHLIVFFSMGYIYLGTLWFKPETKKWFGIAKTNA